MQRQLLEELKGGAIAKALTRGTPKHNYEILGAYSHMVERYNEGTKTDIRLDSDGKFKYYFISYGAWYRGFASIRKVIAVDGTFLTGAYTGVMLSAVAQDAQKQIFPLAFAIVDKECDAAYRYFFRMLKTVVPDSDEMCIISDRHKSIEKAVRRVYPSAHYGFCTRHLGENIRTKFHCGDVIKKFNRAARHYTVPEFNKEMKEIEAIDPRIPIYLRDKVGHEKWSRAHFPGNRHDLMTTNIAESVNSTFKEEREFPIVALMNAINENYGKKIFDRRMELLNSSAICTPKIEDKIQRNMTRGNRMTVKRSKTTEIYVTGGSSQDQDGIVDLHNLTCTCRRWELKQYPCYHAMAALRDCYGDEFGAKIYEYTSHYYSVNAYVLAYAQTIRPIPPEDFWTDIPEDVLARKIQCPDQLKRVGRRKTKRHIGIGERVGKRRNKCGICRRFGHKKTTCPVVTRPSNSAGPSTV